MLVFKDIFMLYVKESHLIVTNLRFLKQLVGIIRHEPFRPLF